MAWLRQLECSPLESVAAFALRNGIAVGAADPIGTIFFQWVQSLSVPSDGRVQRG
jgi:hypothetical protein